jgi:hypothetical protein
MKNKFLPVIMLIVMFSSCGTIEPIAETTITSTINAETTTVATTAATTTTDVEDIKIFPQVTMQEYTDLKMVEVIELTADKDVSTPAMDEMNKAIIEDVGLRIVRYEDLLEESDNNTENYIGGINVWAYSITDENYIQIYNTVFEYPTYGTAGDLFGFVYDIASDDYLTLDEFLESQGTNLDDMTFTIFESLAYGRTDYDISKIELKTFNLSKDDSGEYVYSILFEMEYQEADAEEPFKGFFMYTPIDKEFFKMNPDHLFGPYIVDEYNPPLHCQEGWSYD